MEGHRHLVSPEWLLGHVGEPGLVVADVRWVPDGTGREAYRAGHLPGAVYLDVDADLSGRPGRRGRHPLPSPRAFAEAMGRAGIGDQDLVVAYDDAGGSHAARLWWMLEVTGRRAAVLDGGLTGWPGPRERGEVRRPRARVSARPWPAEAVVGAEELAELLRDGRAVVLDARAPERYRGEVEPYDPRPGHIPGARSAPWEGNLDPITGRFLPPEGLRRRYEALVGSGGGEVVVYCGSGVTACHDVLALRLAGLARARLYVGSWSEWSRDPGRPAVTGGHPGQVAGAVVSPGRGER